MLNSFICFCFTNVEIKEFIDLVITTMLKFLCTVALFLVTVKANDEKSIPYGFFGSKTPYNLVAAPEIEKPKGFTPRQIFMLGRHGTRGPRFSFSNDKMPKLVKYQNKFTERATLNPKDIKAINNWVTIIDTTGDKSITQKGHDEIKDLAIRIREAFSNLFQRQYNSDNYEILSAPDSRCELSGQTFIENIFKDETIPKIPVCDPTDILLQVEGLKKLDTRCKEIRVKTDSLIKEFRTGKYMDGVVQRVADKMGIDSTELDYEIINIMYEVATFELTIGDSAISPWYKIFCQDDLEVFEYADDIFRFYFNGYGDPFNKKLACPMAIRLEERLRNKINGEGPDAVFYHGHSTNILSLYVMLGIGDGDIPFKQSNYKGMKDLKWRTSLFGPWAANVMVVLYEGAENDYRVSFYLNEKLTSITLRDGSFCTVCAWSDIEDKLTAYITDNDCVDLVATNTVRNYKDTKPYVYFGTKTAYKFVSAKEIFVPPSLRDYKPIQIFTLSRHATTSTTKYFYDNQLPKLYDLKGKITKKAKMTQIDIQAIMNWQPSIEFKPNDKELIPKGRVEIKELALRVREAFPDLFEQSNNYAALTMEDERCRESGTIFLQTVYDDTTITDVPKCNNDDFFLTIKNIIPAKPLAEGVEYESQKFKKGDSMKKVVERVNVKMGSDDITLREVLMMYEVCRYEIAFDDGSIPPWCSVFCQEDLEIIEYFDELYWDSRFGYGNPHNLKVACPMALRLLQTLEEKINRKEGPSGVFHYAHRSNMVNLYLIFGVGKDDSPLTASNFIEMKNRKWIASKLCPWAANFMAVLFKNANDDYKVAFYFNEHITSIPLEDGSSCTVCPWLDIQKKLQAYIRDNDCVHFIAENLAAYTEKQKETVLL
ncbi:uncharacterized protein LOC126835150 [Adelges cooleyi]|uniref:uncharacterized protein LOC126835150 n=1 Tax=Adelges cooleyi TaxID=133065 RepID=UPI00217F8336|nr:uncharacterized protein LOC126835150 [Adelges cooleyi]